MSLIGALLPYREGQRRVDRLSWVDLSRSRSFGEGARPLYERALAICEKALGLRHPDTAVSLDHLASLLQAQCDLAGVAALRARTGDR
jgi:hypothetical protein